MIWNKDGYHGAILISPLVANESRFRLHALMNKQGAKPVISMTRYGVQWRDSPGTRIVERQYPDNRILMSERLRDVATSVSAGRGHSDLGYCDPVQVRSSRYAWRARDVLTT
jgi:hypothetical protein